MDRVSFKKHGPRGHSTIKYERFDDDFGNGKYYVRQKNI